MFFRLFIVLGSIALLLVACSEGGNLSSDRTTQASLTNGEPAVNQSAQAENLILKLKDGDVVIKLMPNLAPQHVARVKKLASEGFYNGITFHRVIPNFMAQTGDPTGTGSGGSDYPDLPAEFSGYVYKRGTVGAARTSNPNSANSQFFICFDNSGCRGLTGQYTVWGQVISGMEYVDRIAPGEPPANPDRIQQASIKVAQS